MSCSLSPRVLLGDGFEGGKNVLQDGDEPVTGAERVGDGCDQISASDWWRFVVRGDFL